MGCLPAPAPLSPVMLCLLPHTPHSRSRCCVDPEHRCVGGPDSRRDRLAFRIKTRWRVLEVVSPDLSHSERYGLMNSTKSETRFVHESPEQDLNRPKRLRVVAACDNWFVPSPEIPMRLACSALIIITSRTRKVKCERREGNHSQCQACFEARMECTFRDKERYYAEKGRPASRASHSSGYSHQSSTASRHSSGASHSSSSSGSLKHSPGYSPSSASSGRSPQPSSSPTLRTNGASVPSGMTADAQQYELSHQADAS
jgi:hypothetical protein